MKFYNTKKFLLGLAQQFTLEAMKIDNEEHKADGRQVYYGHDDFMDQANKCSKLSKMPDYITVDEMVAGNKSPIAGEDARFSIDKAKESYERNINSHKEFLDICGYSAIMTDEFYIIENETASDLYERYLEFCNSEHLLSISNVRFSQRLQVLGAHKERKSKGMTYTLYTKP